MTHPLLTKIDDLDAAIGNSVDLTSPRAHHHRAVLAAVRRDLTNDLDPPKHSSTTQVAGATVTHRPDLVYDERARQAATQGDADMPPQKERLAK